MKRLLTILILSIFSAAFFSCKYGFYPGLFEEDSPDKRASSMKNLGEINVDEDVFSFVVVTDVHFGADEKRYDKKFLDWYKNQLTQADTTMRPRFLVCLGDSADKGRKSELDEYNEFLSKIQGMENDVFNSKAHSYTVLGNHDLYNNGWENWKEQVYPYTSYYKLVVRAESGNAVSLFFLDSANGTLADEQRDSLEGNLKADTNSKIVFSHYPIYAGGNLLMTVQDTTERALLLTWFSKYGVKYVFAGHAHKDYGFSHPSFREDVTASYVFQREFRLVTVNTATNTVTSELLSY